MEKANNHEMGNSLFNILYKTTTLSNFFVVLLYQN